MGKEAFQHADGLKLNGRRILVDVERGRTVKTWKPRKLGGGLGKSRMEKTATTPGGGLSGSGNRTAGTVGSSRDQRDRGRDKYASRRDKYRDRDHRDRRRERKRSRSRSRERKDYKRRKESSRRERDRGEGERDRDRDRDRPRRSSRSSRSTRDRERERR